MKNHILSVQLQVNEGERARLIALQHTFAELCNALVPVVRQNHCWNRVGLHHLAYHALRARFPRMGSQMVCNAIYSVSRAYRMAPKASEEPLPFLKFLPGAPVFFDRHTVSIRDNQLSMYTLDGRVRFGFAMPLEILRVFASERLGEIVLHRRNEIFSLSFCMQGNPVAATPSGELPEYLVLLPDAPVDLSAVAPAQPLSEPLEA
ncbi:MAG: hypothetical protein LBU43_04285 [Candidatus Accumulibacter sp.]|jgi:hypothetical protein|nr:hypothetical protein [Accumulibacter sp.]